MACSALRGRLCLLLAASGALSGCSPTPAKPAGVVTLRLGTRDAANAVTVLSRFLFAERLIGIDWNGRPQTGACDQLGVG